PTRAAPSRRSPKGAGARRSGEGGRSGGHSQDGESDMRRSTSLLLRTAGAIGEAFGLVWLSCPAFADDAPRKVDHEAAGKDEADQKADEAAGKAQEAARKMAKEKAAARQMAQKEAARQQEVMVQRFEQQLSPQFRQMYRTELHFLRLVTQPTKQQFEKI